MTELERYLAEEIAIDHADGFVTRREALRRLALLGVGATAAAALLTACADAKKAPATSSSASGGTDAASGGAIPAPAAGGPSSATPTEAITFAGPEGRSLQGAFAKAAQPRGGVLVIHENRGLTDHIRNVAGRLGAAGWSAHAIDLLSEEGGTASLGDSANATAALGKVAPERFVADMRAGLDELAKRVPNAKLGAIGFCFGGGMTWRLVASKDPRLAAAAPFYGPLPDGADFTGSKAAVLGVYAELDARVNASRDPAKAALAKAGLTHEVVTVPAVDHAFFNDTGPRYNAAAAGEIWAKVTTWFRLHIG
jgi:carboxymethylenebutenolidase